MINGELKAHFLLIHKISDDIILHSTVKCNDMRTVSFAVLTDLGSRGSKRTLELIIIRRSDKAICGVQIRHLFS